MKNTSKIRRSFTLTEDLNKELERIAKLKYTSVNNIVVEVLEKYIKDKNTEEVEWYAC